MPTAPRLPSFCSISRSATRLGFERTPPAAAVCGVPRVAAMFGLNVLPGSAGSTYCVEVAPEAVPPLIADGITVAPQPKFTCGTLATSPQGLYDGVKFPALNG